MVGGDSIVQKLLIVALMLCMQQVGIGNDKSLNDSIFFRQIDYEDGLPGNNMRYQIQDHSGIMWISVEGSGVCRYDGQKFTTFKNIPGDSTSISNNFVNHIVESKSNNLWFASDNGLSMFDRETLSFKQFYFIPGDSTSLPHNQCNTIFIDSKQRTWIGTGNGLALLNNNEKTFYNFLNVSNEGALESHFSIYEIVEYPEGTFYLGTNQGLLKFSVEGGILNRWDENGKLINNRVQAFEIDSNEKLWLGTHRGLDRFDLKTQQFDHWHYKTADESKYREEGINGIQSINDSMLWVSTYTKGILIINVNNENYKFIRAESGKIGALQSDHVQYVISDRDGVIWVGTKFGGLFQMNEKINLFKNWPERYKLVENVNSVYIYSFLDDGEVCWVGSKLNGLYKCDLKNDTIINYTFNPSNSNSLLSMRVQALFRDRSGVLWVGTDHGLQFFNGKNDTFSQISDLSINTLFQDDEGTIWAGTVNGLFCVDKGSNKLVRYNDRGDSILFQNGLLDIYSIIQAADGRMWVSTRNNGLFVFDTQSDYFCHYTGNQPLHTSVNSSMVRCLYEDSKKNIWIGTKVGGLNKYSPNTGQFTYYDVARGLPSPLIMSIREDHLNNLWIGTHNGISKFNPESGRFENFNSEVGLKSNIVEPGAIWLFPEGEMLFGGNNGFNIFYSEEVNHMEIEPNVMISNMLVYGKSMVQDVLHRAEMKLSHDQNYISFDFIQLDYKNPYRHNYFYTLEGVDLQWNNSGSRNFVSYSDLKPGNYVFKVKTQNDYGIWSSVTPQINITIAPPFYMKNWFRSLMALLVVTVFFIIYRFQSAKIERHQSELKRLVNERTLDLRKAVEELSEKNRIIGGQKKEIELHHAELENNVRERTRELELAMLRAEESEKLKSSFLANMSHEIRTPLNAICGFSSLLDEDGLDRTTRRQYIDMITTNSTMLLKLIDDILDLSKIEVKQLAINKEDFNVNVLMAGLFSTFKNEVEQQHGGRVKLVYSNLSKHTGEVILYADQYRIKQVLSNLIGNAIKFCRQGEIKFGFADNTDHILFFVKDTGIGIPEELQPKIFNRFIKIEDKKVMYRGTGLGLSISQSIVEMFGGKIWVKSKLGEGSEFLFTISKESKTVKTV